MFNEYFFGLIKRNRIQIGAQGIFGLGSGLGKQ